MELRWHSNDHVIIVRVEVAAFGYVQTEGGSVVITSQQVIGVVDQTRLMGVSLRQLRGPHTVVGVLGLMDSEVGRPDSVMNNTLSVVPLLEVVTSVLLVGGMDLGREHHFVHQFSLLETLVDEEIILLMHSSMATLAGALENLETSPQTKS